MQKEFTIEDLRNLAERAISNVSFELHWKIWFELAQTEERFSNFDLSRKAYSKAVSLSNSSQHWKVFMRASRTELLDGQIENAKRLLERSFSEAPPKMKYLTLLESSKLFEFCQDFPAAERILEKAKKESSGEWKVFLAMVMLQLRNSNQKKALIQIEQALKIHSTTGRLWVNHFLKFLFFINLSIQKK